MAKNFGTGVSRVLDPNQSGLIQVIWQQGKPPLDSELNLLQQLAEDWRRIHALRGTPSGWLGNVTNSRESFLTHPTWSNWFRFGQQRSGAKGAIEWAVVNGWLVPVTGTLTGSPPGSPDDASTWNRVTLNPPPSNSGDSRIDFVFLEVWQARIPPNPSTSNKPSASGLWRYGNVEGGYSFLPDELQDPAIGFETTQRVQLQYRIRVVTGLVGLTSFPDGFDPTLVKARGAAASDTAFVFQNMRQELGDPGLWRAGDGTANSLGTVDGYSYAVPLAAVFRRNSVAWDGDPGQNLNGSFNRNPTAVDRTGWKTFSTTPTLAADITDAALSLTLPSVSNIPLPLTPASPVLIQIGDEYLQYSSITGTTMTISARGVLGSKPEAHKAGDEIRVITGRPDGLFADQVAGTDILDLRHVVNPNGFDYDSLLQANLDKLLRGELRANWKRSGGGPQGSFVFYQDKVSNSAAALGVTKLDGPDNQRLIFSDAAAQQPIEVILSAPAGSSASETVTTTWGLSLTATVDNSGGNPGEFNPGDVISIPIAQLKSGIPGSDTDQVRWLGADDQALPELAVELRIDGNAAPLVYGWDYTITAGPGPSDSLDITLETNFPTGTTRRLYVTAHVLYGPGRGLSRRPDSIHSVAYLSAGSDIMIQLAGVPSDNTPMRTAWAPLWSKFRANMLGGLLPATAEAYADPGSRTVILTPFRRVDMPDITRTLDGTSVNVNTGATTHTGGGVGVTLGSTTFTDGGANFLPGGAADVVVGDALVIASPATVAGTYFVTGSITGTSFAVDRPFPATVTVDSYTVHHTQGLMPLNNRSGTAKWTTTDPLGLFSGTTDPATATKNIFLPLPRRLVPGWGEVRVPIIHSDPTSIPAGGGSTFDEGVNFLVLTKKGDSPGTKPNSERNYVPFSNGSLSYAPFSTFDFIAASPATFNASFTFGGNTFAGMRFFSDTRGLGRKGLELPPFYGIARLFAVYEAQDYQANGSAYDPTTREPTGGGATNLLRQNFDGATFWIEIDSDGDSTFILNADTLDLAKSPTPLASFESGHYVIEANIFGFDRSSFDLNHGFRLVLTRERVTHDPTQAGSGTRSNNIGTGSDADIASPDLVVPGPALASDEIAVNYSRTPYQGDAWGSQTAQQDTGHKPGVLTTGTRFQIQSTVLDEQNLTRPNQKPLEVLSAVAFATTLGSGRISGDLPEDERFDFRIVGYEEISENLPTSGVDPRPPIALGALAEREFRLTVGTEYHGCTDRLPLGASLRDKDFRGNFLSGDWGISDTTGPLALPLAFINDRGPATIAAGVARTKSFEQTEIDVHTVSLASGQPGEVIVHVDGEQGNYGLLTNFRTNRGGSVFSASSPRPGGELATLLYDAGPHGSDPHVLSGLAMLVRNAPTSIGATEVSAGSELMMVIATTGTRLHDIDPIPLRVVCGTNGTGEGDSAADLYRLEGRPLVVDNTRLEVDPSDINLSKSFPVG